MPTQSAFLAAADQFESAAGQLGSIASTLHQLDSSSVVHGGRLGAETAESLTACGATASACVNQVLSAAAVCRHRAAVIAAYEAQLQVYYQLLGGYEASQLLWTQQFNAWFMSDGLGAYPAWNPIPPTAPVPPPAWADVVRP